ncbi:ribosome maturation factor RimP [Lachnospiraceae bacterium 62-35]
MTKRENYESRVEKYLLPLMEKQGFELVDVEYVKEAGTWYLRAYIDKEGGISVDDCEIISRDVSDWLDKEDFIEESYILEVSSPGLGRPLKKEKDFVRSIGKDVEIRLYRPKEIEGQKGRKEFNGVLKAFDKATVTLEEDGTEIIFQRQEIGLIRLAFDF